MARTRIRSAVHGVVTACAAACALVIAVAPDHAQAEIIRTTNFGLGADAEVRESAPTQNRGDSTELATRVRNALPGDDVNDGSDRNSVMYLQFDLAGLTVADTADAVLRLTYRNNNLAADRIADTDGLPPDLGRTGLTYYGIERASFDESTITYNNAPGITPDGNVGTTDFNALATPLGSALFPEIGTQNHLPIGGALDFTSAALDAFLADAIGNGLAVVVLAVVRLHDGSPDEPAAGWHNFNYLFNPKEQTTLNTDNYDPGTGDVGNLFGTDNSTGAFSPQLVLNSAAIPTPAALPAGLIGLGLLAARRRRRV